MTRSEPRVVFLLAHMRSGSTLLMHLLMSHRSVLGYGERNRPYASPVDLDRLEVAARYHRRTPFRTYALLADQVNHNRFLIDETLLREPRVRGVFLIRQPEASLASMIDVLGRLYHMTAEEIQRYYVDRLAALARYTCLVDDRSGVFLTYENLLNHSDLVLRRLAAFLELEPGLSDRYRCFDFTGIRGDPSEHIRSGQIARNKPGRDLRVPPNVLEPAREAYHACYQALVRRFGTGLSE